MTENLKDTVTGGDFYEVNIFSLVYRLSRFRSEA